MVSKGNVFVVVVELHDAPPLVNKIAWHVHLTPTRKTQMFAKGFGAMKPFVGCFSLGSSFAAARLPGLHLIGGEDSRWDEPTHTIASVNASGPSAPMWERIAIIDKPPAND